MVTKKDTGKINFVNTEGTYLLLEDADGGREFCNRYTYIRNKDKYFILDQKRTLFKEVEGKIVAYLGLEGMYETQCNNTYYLLML